VPEPPLISVIIPVYQVQGYLAECLDSVLGQKFADVEVIAVDGGSTDGSATILDERAARDGRLRVLHLGRTGPGPARNEGLRQATGDYVWFVDGDDALTARSLEAVADLLRRNDPDVLLIDYEYVYPDGHTAPSPGVALLGSLPDGCFTLAQQPAVINLAMTIWSKIIRREFLVSLGQPFPDGIHEDVPVSCAALLSASKISAVQATAEQAGAVQAGAAGPACYRYRQHRRGSFMIQTTEAHFDIFRSYRLVFELAAKRAAGGDPMITGPVEAALFERAIWHYTTILGKGGWGIGPVGADGLVPRRLRRRFFAMMHADFLTHRPAGYRHPAGARGAKFRLIERDAYWTYSVLEPLNMLLRARVRQALSRN
jgi:glycosyltransferase involved in cell wall biosynthesis